jgi:Holliday junction resolvase-like predicted endonuclease
VTNGTLFKNSYKQFKNIIKMAKQNNEKKPVAITADNVIEQAKAGNTLTPELKAKMDQELKDEKDKRVLREVKARYAKIAYNVGIGLVNLRKMRAFEAISLYNMRQQGRLQRFLCGFDVTEQVINEYAKTPDDILELEKLDEKKKVLLIMIVGEDGKTREEKEFKVGDHVNATIDFTEFDKGLVKLEDTLKKKMTEANDAHTEETKVIQQAAGEYWRSDWAYNVRVVGLDGLDRGNRW